MSHSEQPGAGQHTAAEQAAAARRAWRRRLPLIGLLVVVGILSFLVRGFFREVMLIPAIEFITLLRLIYRSTPQIFIWIILLLLVLPFLLRALWVRPYPPEKTRAEPVYIGRVHQLTHWMRQSRVNPYFTWQVAQAVNDTIVAAIAQRMRESADTIRQRARNGDLVLDPVLLEHLQTGERVRTYRRFVELRDSGALGRGYKFNSEAALQALEAWLTDG